MPGKLKAGILCLALSLSASWVADAQESESSPTTDRDYATPVENSVRTMLSIETALALKKEQERYDAALKKKMESANCSGGDGNTSGNASIEAEKAVAAPQKVAPTVLGIFGLGNSLFADLNIDGERVRFQRGQAHPLGYPSDYLYRLVEIKTPCVSIKHAAEMLKVCLRGGR